MIERPAQGRVTDRTGYRNQYSEYQLPSGFLTNQLWLYQWYRPLWPDGIVQFVRCLPGCKSNVGLTIIVLASCSGQLRSTLLLPPIKHCNAAFE